ncbi:hypothetical protein [Streptomyces sp. 351MFTsu5.1]|uniref:hypothetical protein n=1 Tax=Streptomyces sp. 351MFTsu5.1 TaxID=1172180 RepID=UPI0003798722|nr:hypothetical protein [Streptomyces sp. 351MFTsu5.1]
MTDHFARPRRAATSAQAARIAELHALCDQDYAKGELQRAAAQLSPYVPSAPFWPAPEPSDLAVAIRVAQQMLVSDDVLKVREALRLLLRSLDAEPISEEEAVRRSVDRAFPVVAAFLATERGADQ